MRLFPTSLIVLITLFTQNATSAEETNQQTKDNNVSIHFSSEQDELQAVMKSLFTSTQLPCNTPRWKIKESLEDDISDIQKAAHAYGYYHLQLQPEIKQEKNCWKVNLAIKQGPRTLVEAIDITFAGEAQTDPTFNQLIKENPVKIGEPLYHRQYEALKKQIETVAAKRGYFDGRFTVKQLKVNPQENSATIVLHYLSGKRYRIGKLDIEQDALDETLFNEYINLQPGDLFDDNQLVASYQNLSSNGYYSSVEVTPILDQRKDNTVPVLIRAISNKPKSYTVGVGASTDTGPRIRFTHDNRLVNQYGYSYRTELSLSPVISNANFSYRIPGDKPQTDFYEFSTQAIHEDTDTSNSDTFNISASRSDLIRNDWTRLISLQYSLDDFDVGEDNDSTMLLRPTLGFSTTQANSILRPTKGYRINLELTGAHSSALSDIDFIQAQLNTKFIKSLGSSFRWLSRLDLGYTDVNDFSELPSNLRFFAGGDNSIRGYDFEALGPEDDAGDVLGGEGLIVGSVEMDYLFTDNWSGAVFVDAGNAFNDDQIDVRIGAGFGVRWQSPIGPIRVDIGLPVDDPDADDSWRLHFSLGPDL